MEQGKDDEVYLKPKEVADIFRVHKSTIYRMIDEGTLRAVRVTGSDLRIPRSEVLRILEGSEELEPPRRPWARRNAGS